MNRFHPQEKVLLHKKDRLNIKINMKLAIIPNENIFEDDSNTVKFILNAN
jgi:hypothetical protein